MGSGGGFPGKGQWEAQELGLLVPSLTGCMTTASHSASSSLSFPTYEMGIK